MQNTSSITNWDTIVAGDHWYETKVVIYPPNSNTALLTLNESQLISVSTSNSIFGGSPEVGMAVAGEIDLVILYPTVEIPTMAKLRPYVRAKNATLTSGWLPQGIFFIDTRERTRNDSGLSFMTIHGYDAMLKAEQMYSGRITGSSTDKNMVNEIAYQMGVSVDSRTTSLMNKAYTIPLPTGYTYREVLGYIASMYAGCFIITDEGKLRLVTIYDLPAETNYLIDTAGNWITFGGDRILV